MTIIGVLQYRNKTVWNCLPIKKKFSHITWKWCSWDPINRFNPTTSYACPKPGYGILSV